MPVTCPPASPSPTRRTLLGRFGLLATATAATLALPAWARSTSPGASPSAQRIPVEVWKDANCGCCQDWVDHMEQHGFAVTVHSSGNAAVRSRLGLPAELGSCHTAVLGALVGGYLVEGHVPAADVHKLLQQRPQALGITVPGMPIGSPGMDGPVYGGRKDAYDVLLVARAQAGRSPTTTVFSRYR